MSWNRVLMGVDVSAWKAIERFVKYCWDYASILLAVIEILFEDLYDSIFQMRKFCVKVYCFGTCTLIFTCFWIQMLDVLALNENFYRLLTHTHTLQFNLTFISPTPNLLKFVLIVIVRFIAIILYKFYTIATTYFHM